MNLPSDFHPAKELKTFETDSTLFWFDENIQYVFCKPGIIHTLEHANEQVIEQAKHTKQIGVKQVSIICDVRQGIPLEKSVRDFYSSPERQETTLKFAFIVQSALSKVMANFFINLRKMDVPIQMFTDIKEAKKWCNN